jgi:hypothetical protein
MVGLPVVASIGPELRRMTLPPNRSFPARCSTMLLKLSSAGPRGSENEHSAITVEARVQRTVRIEPLYQQTVFQRWRHHEAATLPPLPKAESSVPSGK